MFPEIQLYVALALAATLASVVATHLRSYTGKRKTRWLASGTCILLGAAWLHLLATLACKAWQAEQVVLWQLVVHSLVIVGMLPIVCTTVMQSWTSGAKTAAQV